MANLYITEFSGLGKTQDGYFQAPLVTALAEQKVAYTTSTQSSVLNKDTKLVRLQADAICHIEIGDNPTATAANMRLIADQTEYFAIPYGQSLIIAAYDGSS